MLDVDLASSLGAARNPPVWVAFESNTQTYPVKPKRRKGARGRVSAEEMAAMIESGGKNNNSRLRPDQIEALRLKREPKDHSVTCLEQEDGEGNVEYKYRIKDPHPVRLQQLITQLKFRLSEGNGECFYYIGVEDNGYPKGLEPADLDGSIGTLQHMAAPLGACVSLVHYLPGAWGRRAALLRVAHSTAQEACHTDLRIAVAGSVEAGKSTLVAVLSTGSDGRPLLDNGRGLARMAVFRHKHEMQSGRTSSICHQLLGYDGEGRVINYATPAATALTPAEITGAAAKVLTFLDMGGHEKYLKTALYGMTALLPDYSLLCVCAAAGLGRVAREHLAVAVALEVPVAVIITKVELVRPERFAAVVAEVRQLVALTLQHESGAGAVAGAVTAGSAAAGANTPGDDDDASAAVAAAAAAQAEQRRVEEASPLVGSEAEAVAAARVLGQLHADSLASPTARGALCVHMPIFAVSAVTGAGLPVLHAFLAALQPGPGPLKGAAVATPLEARPVAAAPGGEAPAGCGGGSAGGGVGGACGAAESGYASSSCGWASAGGSPRVAAGDVMGASLPPFGPNGVEDGEDREDVAAAAAAAATAAGAHHHQLLYAPAGGAAAPAAEAQAVHFQVDGTFEVEGVGSVVSGTLVSGTLRLGQELVLGPTAAGGFTRVVVRQLQRSHVQVKCVRAGQTCTIAISPTDAADAAPAAAQAAPAAVAAAAAVGVLPYGSSPSAAPGGYFANAAGGCGGAATATAAAVPGSVAAAAAAGTGATGGGAGGGIGGGGGGDFDDALAAAQTALELCLGLDDDDDEADGGNAADDDMFGFDACDAPPAGRQARGGPAQQQQRQRASHTSGGSAGAGTTPSLSPSLSHSPGGFGGGGGGGGAGGGGGGYLPFSMSVSQLHSTTSFCVGGAVAGGAGSGSGGAAGGRGSAAAAPAGAVPGLLSSSAPMHNGSGLQLASSLGACGPGCSPPGLGSLAAPARKGAVLLEPALQPRTSWAFEAVLILLGGHWPPRGLLSGRWPPLDEDDLPARAAAAEADAAMVVVAADGAAGAEAEAAHPPADHASDSAACATEPPGGSSGHLSSERSGSMTPGGGAGGATSDDCSATVGSAAAAAAAAAAVAAVVTDASGAAVRSARAVRTASTSGAGGAKATPMAVPSGAVRTGSVGGASGAGRRRRQRSGSGGNYVMVVHCGSVRQPAYVVSMQELLEEPEAAGAAAEGGGADQLADAGAARSCPELRISASTRAAAALLHSARAHGPASPTSIAAAAGGGADQGDLGCLVRVALRWQHRPEWLREGAKLLVRDRSDGRIAGAGFVRRAVV